MAKYLVFVHGIGELSYSVARSFERNMAPEVEHFDIQLKIFWWKQLVTKREEKLKKIIGKFPKDDFFGLKLNMKDAIETYLILRLKQLMVEYFGDAIFYTSDKSSQVQARLEKTLLAILKKDRNAQINLVAHSLGSVVVFDLLTNKKSKAMRIGF